MIIYLAGPMRGYPQYNFRAFDDKEKSLRSEGHLVINPAELDRMIGFDAYKLPIDHDCSGVPAGFSFDKCVDRDLCMIRQCNAIYMLRGWRESRGARAELALAEWLGHTILMEEWESSKCT